jgi:hypothetical protein
MREQDLGSGSVSSPEQYIGGDEATRNGNHGAEDFGESILMEDVRVGRINSENPGNGVQIPDRLRWGP